MKLFVINLAESTERREAITQQISRFNLDYEFFEAVDGRTTKHPLFDRYQPRKNTFCPDSTMSGGELGCWASHYLLWETCVKTQQTIVVLEDDITIDSQFPKALEAAEALLEKHHYIRLSCIWDNKHKHVDTQWDYTLVRYVRPPSGTQAYMISPIAAQTFIEHAENWQNPVDNFIDSYWVHKIECNALKPFSVHLTDLPSEIDRDTNKPKLNLLQKLEKEYLRVLNKIHRFKHNTKYML